MELSPKSSLGSRGQLIVLGLLVFFACFFGYAHTDLLDIGYHLVVDGCLLAVWIVAAWGMGQWIVQTGPGILVQVTRIAVGLGVLSILILLLGLAGGLEEISALILLAVGFVLSLVAIAGQRNGRKNFSATLRRWFSASAGPHWLLLLLAPFAAMMAAGGLIMPGLLWGADDPSGYDVVEYHLQVPREWYELGRIAPLHHNVFSFFPFNVEMHYLLAMHLHAGPWAGMFLAQWMHGIFIALTIAAIYAAVRAFASPFAACLAAVAAGVCPWLTMLGSVAYDEGGLLLYAALTIAWLIIFLTNENGNMAFVLIAGLCAGLACGCKLTAVPILLIALPIIFVCLKPNARTIKHLFAYVAIALLAFSPWLIRNQIWAHNPVFPEGTSFLGHGDFSPIQIARWHQAHSPRPDQQSVAAHLQAFWNQVIIDWRFAYVLLPISLFAAIVSLRNQQTRFLILSLLVMALFWIVLTHLQSRFFVLAIPMMAMLIGTIRSDLLKWTAIPIVLCAVPAFFFLHQEMSPLSQTIGLESPTQLRSQIYPPEINTAVADNKPLILVGDAKAFWFDIPMSRLHYRTVFDVDTSDGRPTISAWIGDAANLSDANVIIDPGEIERFSKTYLGIPLQPAIHDLRGTTVFGLHDSWVQQ
jgi:Dolichyl-phosphate-mannose-protein mannosyltransferase